MRGQNAGRGRGGGGDSLKDSWAALSLTRAALVVGEESFWVPVVSLGDKYNGTRTTGSSGCDGEVV
jgi:hypothetical protein